MSRRQRADSVNGEIRRKKAADAVIPLPDGVVFDTDEEMVLWRQFTAARSAELWREFDLLLIAKMVKLEARIRKHNALLDRTGPIIENKRGTMVENPMLRVVDTLQRQQLAVVRSLSLGVSSNTAADQNKTGASAAEKEDLSKLRKGDVVNLLSI